MLIATCLFGVGLGLSLGYAIFSPRPERLPVQEPAELIASRQPSGPEASESAPGMATPASSSGYTAPGSAGSKAAAPALPDDGYWAARHLFITVNGQWLAEGTEDFLRVIRPGGVLLRDNNLGTRTQTFELVKQIKHAVGLGEGLGDLPLIAVQQEGGPYNLLDLASAPSAQTVGQRNDADLAQKLGMEYGQACVGRGIALAFAPVLDVYEGGSINPNLAVRTFGNEQTLVARMGLAMINGLRQGGVLPVVKHFPGYGAATYGPDGLLVVLNKDYSGLAKVMYPFNEAVRHGVPGVMVGYVAVPALDPENPRRPAALSPILIQELLRGRWGYEGVVIADDIAFNPMTRAMGPEKTAVQALAAGCDALVMLDPDPARIRSVCAAIAEAVESGELDRAKLDQSVARLERWQHAIGNLNPLPAQEESQNPTQVALRPDSTPAATRQPIETSTPPRTNPAKDEPTAEPQPQVTAPVQLEARAAQPKPDAAATEAPEPETPAPAEPEPTRVADARPSPAEDTKASADAETLVLAPAAGEAEAGGELEHIVQAGESLSDVAAFYGVSPEDLRDWNKLEGDTVDEGTKLTVRLPDTSGPEQPAAESGQDDEETKVASVPKEPSGEAAAEEPEDEAPAADTDRLREITYKVVHSVKEGETLAELAELYAVAAEDIRLWNGLNAAELEPGQQLTIFVGAETKAELASESESTSTSEPAPEVTTQAEPDSTEALETETYVVQSGDTVLRISREYNTSKEVILELNGLDDPNHIWVGQKLKVPARSSQSN